MRSTERRRRVRDVGDDRVGAAGTFRDRPRRARESRTSTAASAPARRRKFLSTVMLPKRFFYGTPEVNV
jgi:hypothetical protein